MVFFVYVKFHKTICLNYLKKIFLLSNRLECEFFLKKKGRIIILKEVDNKKNVLFVLIFLLLLRTLLILYNYLDFKVEKKHKRTLPQLMRIEVWESIADRRVDAYDCSRPCCTCRDTSSRCADLAESLPHCTSCPCVSTSKSVSCQQWHHKCPLSSRKMPHSQRVRTLAARCHCDPTSRDNTRPLSCRIGSIWALLKIKIE